MPENKKPELYRTTTESAAKIAQWFRERGGIAIWRSLDLANPGRTWTTPIKQENGEPALKPHWAAESSPSRTITDPSEVVVDVPKEVKRFHVALRRSGNGLSIKCTDGSSAKIRKWVTHFGEQNENRGGAWYEFDYSTQECVIYVAGETLALKEWEAKQPQEVNA